ncbi:MAG: hypothetical protein KQI35_09185 [Bacteroidetes bacterium]|nr:hypothetical protein [Bacteroidota bacterium]
MKKIFFLILIYTSLSLLSVNAQTRIPGTFTYAPDFIISSSDTIHCQIDPESLNTAKIKYVLPAEPEKIRSMKTAKIDKLKCRFIYSNVEVNGKLELLKVLTEDQISLYSREKKGKTQISDKEPNSVNPAQQVPSRSTFYIGEKNGTITELSQSNYKAVLNSIFEGDDALLSRVNDLKFEDLEFTLLNMVIRYNFRLNNQND